MEKPMPATMSDVISAIARQTDTPTDEFTQDNVIHTLIDFSADMWTPSDISEDAHTCGFNFPTRAADEFLASYVGVIVSTDLDTNDVHTFLFRDSDQMDLEWETIKQDAQYSAVYAWAE